MRELRFHRELYRGESVDEAIERYAGHAEITAVEEGDYRRVRIEAASSERELRIAGELANYALGLTIQNRTG